MVANLQLNPTFVCCQILRRVSVCLSWSRQPNQPIAWLTRLFTFMPVMATALGEPIPDWWQELLIHLPPQPLSGSNAGGAVGAGQIYEVASNQNNVDDNLTPIWPAEVATILGEVPDRLRLNAGLRTLLQQGPAVRPNTANPRFNSPYIDYYATRGESTSRYTILLDLV